MRSRCKALAAVGGARRGAAGERLLLIHRRDVRLVRLRGGKIVAVGAENEYADVIQQVGGKYVQVSAIMSNPNTDPHTFEASASVAQLVSAAQLVVQNGVGYDRFMNTIENAAPSSSRKVVVVQNLLGLPDSTPEPAPVVQAGHHAGRRERHCR